MAPRAPLRNATAASVLALALGLQACSSVPLRKSYEDLTLEGRMTFLARFPDMNDAQRREFLARQPRPNELPPEQAYTIVALELSTSAPLPVSSGQELPVRATVRYAGGKSADATHYVDWRTEGAPVTLEHGTLRYGCLASDVLVAADFFSEREGRKIIEFRKPLRRLEVLYQDPTSKIERSEYYRLAVIAHCEDGTASDVSCQANWESSSPYLKVGNCGQLRVAPGRETPADFEAHIVVTYGGLRAGKRVLIPASRH
ncbi:MAG: hypothetical protein NDJ90_02940 [Oligoflexia bacterium]|nr:hypothetical protein [Oligoflexia bacterium]